MTIDDRLEMKSCNMILTEKLQNYQNYHLEKLMNMNNLQVKKHRFLIKDKIVEEVKFSFFHLGKAFEKLTEDI